MIEAKEELLKHLDSYYEDLRKGLDRLEEYCAKGWLKRELDKYVWLSICVHIKSAIKHMVSMIKTLDFWIRTEINIKYIRHQALRLYEMCIFIEYPLWIYSDLLQEIARTKSGRKKDEYWSFSILVDWIHGIQLSIGATIKSLLEEELEIW